MDETPQGDFLNRIARGEHPFAAAARPMEGGSTEIRGGHLSQQFAELRSFLAGNVYPDLEPKLASLHDEKQAGVPIEVGEYKSVDVDISAPFLGMTESGDASLTLHQGGDINTRVMFRPNRLEKFMSVDISTDFGIDPWEGGTYVSLSSHGRGYPYREQMMIGAEATLFSGKGSVSIVQECNVNESGDAPATSIELRFYDDSEKGKLPDHKIATYVKREGKFVLDDRGRYLDNVRAMGIQLPGEVVFDQGKGELVFGAPNQVGGNEKAQEVKITFPEKLSPGDYLEAVKQGTVSSSVLGGFNVA